MGKLSSLSSGQHCLAPSVDAPLGQDPHAVIPSVSAEVPAWHRLHLVRPTVPPKLPGPQNRHSLS
eukprot:182988-Amphidinium_carterae.1